MKRKPKTTSEWIAIILVPLVCLLNIGFAHGFIWDVSFIISFLGLAYTIAFLLNFKIYVELLFVFAFSQLVIIRFPIGEKFFNLSQLLDLYIGINLNHSSLLFIGIGVPGIFLLALAILVMMDSIFGTKLQLHPFKNDKILVGILPAEVEIIKRMKIGEETSWYLVRFLNTEAEMCGMIRANDSYTIKKGKNQIVEFWLVEDPSWILKSPKVERKLLRKPGKAIVE